MATTVDTLLVRIEADMSDLKSSLNKVQRDVDKSSRGISSSFKKIGMAMKGAVAAVLVQQGLKAGAALVRLGSDVEEMQGKSKVVFGEFRKQVVEDLEAFGDAVGRSTHELEGMASSIQDTFVPMGFGRGEAAKLSVELTKLAVDVASFNNASDTETMAAFQSALVGNHETVRRFGVVITEATLNQELMRMGIEKGTKAATEAQKVQARLNLITRGTSDAAGDAARTSGSFANQTRALMAELSELGVILSEILLPFVTQVTSKLLEAARGAKTFLEAVGLLSQYSKDVGGMDAQIEDLANSIAVLEKQGENQTWTEYFLSFGKDIQLTIDSQKRLLATLVADRQAALDELALQNREAAFATDVSVPSGGAGPAPTPIDPEAKKQAEAFAELRSELRINARLEKDLREARASGDKEQVRVALAQIEYQKLYSKFNLMDAKDRRQTALLIADQTLEEEARAQAIKDAADAKAKAKEIEQEFNASVEKGVGFVRQNIDLAYQYEQIQADLNKAKQAGKITEDEYAQALEITKQKILELDPLYKQLSDRANQAFDTMADSLTDMVMSGKFDLKSLGDLFKRTLNEMIADALKAQVIKPILSGIFGAIGGSIGGPFGSFIGGIGKAGGGDIDRPTLVGERGPELFVPHSAGTIMNNHNTKNALGGGGATVVNQTINVDTGVAQTVRAEMMSLLPRFKQDTMAAVVDAKRRGGSYGSAFG